MRTIRITLTGGPCCGECFTDCPQAAQAITVQNVRYVRSERRDIENRQVFIHHIKRESLKLPKQSDLG
ncbi:MAG: hypothetical protein V4726_07185 [Verrucomicrobiota bacterium]